MEDLAQIFNKAKPITVDLASEFEKAKPINQVESNQMIDDTYSSPDQFKGTMDRIQNNVLPELDKVKQGVGGILQLPSRFAQEVLNKAPTDIINELYAGGAKNLHDLNSIGAQALTPTTNYLTTLLNQATGKSFENPINNYAKYSQEQAHQIAKENEANPAYELSSMATAPANVMFGVNPIGNVIAGSMLPAYESVAQGKTPDLGEMATSGATIGVLNALLHNGGKLANKALDTKPKDIQVPQEQAQGLTANEAEVAQNLAKQFEQAKPEEYNGQVIPIPKDIIDKQIEIINDENSTPMQIKQARDVLTVARAEEKRNQPTLNKPETPQGKSLEEQMELIRTHDKGGEEQAQNYKAQMQSWADRENANRVEQGLEPTVTADDMARENYINYENKAKPTEAELNTLFETATDENGNFKTLGDRNKSHGWQDTQNTDAYGQEYTTRMAGERGLDSEITTPVQTLKKLKEEGYNALSDAERAIVDRDIDTIRNHPDFKTLEQKDNGLHVNEHGELVDADGNYLFQSKRENKISKNIYKTLEGEKTSTQVGEYKGIPLILESGDYWKQNGEIKGFGLKKIIEKHIKEQGDLNYIELIKSNVIREHSEAYINNGNLVFDFPNKKNAQFRIVFGDAVNKDKSLRVLPNGSQFKTNISMFELSGKDGRLIPVIPDNGFKPSSVSLSGEFPELQSTSTKIISQTNKLNQGELPQGVKGMFDQYTKLITILGGHDFSTLTHELGHRFLTTLSEKELSVASEIFGVKDGKWTRENHEAFADAYARYIAERKAPQGLKAIFEKFRQFTIQLLKDLKENNGGKMPKLSPEMKEFFSATLGHEPSRAKLLERIKEKESKADMEDGTLYQTASQKEHLKKVYKDSHPLTKNEDGTPKVFYHGSPYDISSFKNGNYDFIYFTESPKYAERYALGNDKVGGIYPVYIQARKIFDTRNPKDKAIFEKEFYMKYGNATKLDAKTGLPDWVEAKELKEFFEDKGYNYDGVMLSENPDNVGNGISLGVVNPTQIKSIHNKPLSEGKSPDFENSNILYQLPQNLLATPQRPNFGNDKKNMQWATDKIKSVVSSATESIRDMTPDFYKELSSDRHTGISNITDRAELIHKGLLNLSPETNKILQQAIVGDAPLPKGYELLQPLVDGINREIKAYSKILVDEGMLDKDTALAYEKYLKRSYANHWEEAGNIQGGNDKGVKKIISRGKEVSTKDAEEVYNFVDDYLLANGKQDLGTQMDVADIKQHLIDEGLIGSSIVDGKITWKEDGAGNISLHRDWTKAERESMGEIENASVTVPHTLLSMGMMIQNAKFMKELSLTARDFKNIDEAQANGYDQVPNSPRYGASAGLYLDKHIVSDIKYSYEQAGVIWKEYQKTLSIWKQGKTVFNPASHVNNFLGNITAQMLMGRTLKEATSMLGETTKQLIEFNSKVPRYEELITKDFIGMLDANEKAELTTLKNDLKYYIEGKENGLFGRGQIHDLLKGFNAQTNSFKGKGIIQSGLEKVQETYGTGDNIPRLASYKVLRENGMSVKDAKEFVTELFPDYTKPLPPAFRFLRDWGLSPFIAWSYYVLPNIWKLAKLHPARAIGILGLAYAIPALISGRNPFGEEMPDKEKGRRVPISKDGTTLKIDRFLPGFDFASVPMDMANQLVSNGVKGNLGKGVNNAISAGARDVGKLAQDYLAGGLIKLPIEVAYNQNFYTGRNISGDTQNAGKQTYNYLKHIAGTLAPAPLANLGGIAENAIDPKIKKAHSEVVPRTNTQELLKIIGINTMTYDPNEVKRNRILEEMKYLKGK